MRIPRFSAARLWLSLVAASVLSAGIAVVACSSSTSDTPASCRPDSNGSAACSNGQTCWPLDDNGTFGCVSAGSGTQGTTCQNTFGVATCASGLACDQTMASGGICTAYCASDAGCPEGLSCGFVASGDAGTNVTICRDIPTDGGTLGVTVGMPGDGTGTGTTDDAAIPDATAPTLPM